MNILELFHTEIVVKVNANITFKVCVKYANEACEAVAFQILNRLAG